LFAPHICGAILRAHSIRGEPHIQRNVSEEVATASVATRGLNIPTPALHNKVPWAANNAFLQSVCGCGNAVSARELLTF